MTILGVVLLLIGLFVHIKVLLWLGIALVIVGALLLVGNRSGRGPMLY